MRYVSRDEYMVQINQIIMLLEGKTSKIIKELEEEMKQASEKLDFEKAANLRDRISAIERISAKQKFKYIRK